MQNKVYRHTSINSRLVPSVSHSHHSQTPRLSCFAAQQCLCWWRLSTSQGGCHRKEPWFTAAPSYSKIQFQQPRNNQPKRFSLISHYFNCNFVKAFLCWECLEFRSLLTLFEAGNLLTLLWESREILQKAPLSTVTIDTVSRTEKYKQWRTWARPFFSSVNCPKWKAAKCLYSCPSPEEGAPLNSFS